VLVCGDETAFSKTDNCSSDLAFCRATTFSAFPAEVVLSAGPWLIIERVIAKLLGRKKETSED
jgi:hypothetical protein